MPNIPLPKLRQRASWSKAAGGESPAAAAAVLESAAHTIATTETAENETAMTGAQAMLMDMGLSTDVAPGSPDQIIFRYLGPSRGHSYRL